MKSLVGIASLVLVLMAVTIAPAQYGGGDEYGRPAGSAAAGQLQTARQHAGFAAGSEVLSGALDHLAHTVNCLEGQRGANYNARALNPCQGQGNGIIPDLQADSGRMGAARALELAREADRMAVEALKVTELARAKSAASRVAELLGQALTSISQ